MNFDIKDEEAVKALKAEHGGRRLIVVSYDYRDKKNRTEKQLVVVMREANMAEKDSFAHQAGQGHANPAAREFLASVIVSSPYKNSLSFLEEHAAAAQGILSKYQAEFEGAPLGKITVQDL